MAVPTLAQFSEFRLKDINFSNRSALDYLQEELPSTLVNLVQPIDMGFYLDAMQRPLACRLASKGSVG